MVQLHSHQPGVLAGVHFLEPLADPFSPMLVFSTLIKGFLSDTDGF